MSFILDALKKSENERQRHQGPSLVDVPNRRAPSERPWWVIVLAALLVLNLIVFIVVLLRKDEHDTAAGAAPPAMSPAHPLSQSPPLAVTRPQPSEPPPAPSTSHDPTVRSLAEEAGVAEGEDAAPPDPALADAAGVPAGPPIVSPIQGPTASPVRTPPPAARNDETLPTLNDVTATGAAQLPEMHLDIHVYATAPAERFVFINMKKYREGETTAEGVTVEQIRRDGVVLNHQGMRFVMPRQ
ncbi:MAG: general secretion pathway protein GspB [Steroidobacteraceae bacterium]